MIPTEVSWSSSPIRAEALEEAGGDAVATAGAGSEAATAGSAGATATTDAAQTARIYDATDLKGIFEHITDRDLEAAQRELNGETVSTRSDGTPYDHVDEVRNAQNGLMNRIDTLKKMIGSGRLTPDASGLPSVGSATSASSSTAQRKMCPAPLASGELSALLDRVKDGEKLPPDIVDAVAATVAREETTDRDRYTALHILGLAGARQYRSLLERYLEDPADPMLARIAILGLARYWSEPERYLDYVVRAVEGQEWDYLDDVQLVAISIAGDYLSDHDDPDLLRTLIGKAQAAPRGTGMRGATLDALARAMGLTWPEIVRREQDPDYGPKLIAQAAARLPV